MDGQSIGTGTDTETVDRLAAIQEAENAPNSPKTACDKRKAGGGEAGSFFNKKRRGPSSQLLAHTHHLRPRIPRPANVVTGQMKLRSNWLLVPGPRETIRQ